MGQGKHPLDVFRSTTTGFDHASRSRRTVAGKVISSQARADAGAGDADAGDGEPASGAAPDAAPPTPRIQPAARRPLVPRAPVAPRSSEPPKPSTKSLAKAPTTKAPQRPAAPGAARKVLLGLLPLVSKGILPAGLLVLAGAAVWIVAQMDFGRALPPLSQASMSEVLPTGPESIGAPAAPWYSIRVGSYAGTPKGQELAWETRDALEARGFPVLDPLGVEELDAQGVPALVRCDIYIGRQEERGALEALLARVRAVADWPTGDPAPFKEAAIVNLPVGAAP